MPRLSKLVLLPAALSVAACLAVVPGVGQESPTFKMTISRSVNLARLNVDFTPGQLFDKGKVTSLIADSKSNNDWHQVPAFYVGHWYPKESTGTYRRNEPTGEEDLTPKAEHLCNANGIGNYADKTGQVWQHDELGSWLDYEGADDPEVKHFCEISRKQRIVTASEYAYDTEFIVTRTDRRTNIITRCDRGTTEVSIHPIDSNDVASTVVERTFKLSGNAVETTVTKTKYEKTSQLVPDPNWKSDDGQPLYPLFVQFLKDNGMADRIPDAPPAAPGAVAEP